MTRKIGRCLPGKEITKKSMEKLGFGIIGLGKKMNSGGFPLELKVG